MDDYLKSVEGLKTTTDFYEYEKRFVQLHEDGQCVTTPIEDNFLRL